MLNKRKIGKFLYQLRSNKGLTQKELANKLYSLGDESFYVSEDSISQWEHGKTIPEIYNLEKISQYYQISIGEILDGELHQEKDYLKIYPCFNIEWTYENAKSDNCFENYQTILNQAYKRLYELLNKDIQDNITLNELDELRFLFINMCQCSDYCFEIYKDETKDEFDNFRCAMEFLLIEISNMSNKEKMWEVEKLFDIQSQYEFHFHYIEEDQLRLSPIIKERFENLPQYKKDILLATVQYFDPTDIKKNQRINGEEGIIQIYGKNYNVEQIMKDKICFMIENGACLNRQYFKTIEIIIKQERAIDRLDYLYFKYVKPIKVLTNINGEKRYNEIENNPKNRFLTRYMDIICSNINNFDIDDFYQEFLNNDDFPKKYLLKMAEFYGIDQNQNEDDVIKKVNRLSGGILDDYHDFKNEEKMVPSYLKEIKNLENRLNSNQLYYETKTVINHGSKSNTGFYSWCISKNEDLTLDELNNSRDLNATKQLLYDLDKLSYEEIKNVYFKKEEQ